MSVESGVQAPTMSPLTDRAIREFVNHFHPMIQRRLKTRLREQLADVLTASGASWDGSRVRARSELELRRVLCAVMADSQTDRTTAVVCAMQRLHANNSAEASVTR